MKNIVYKMAVLAVCCFMISKSFAQYPPLIEIGDIYCTKPGPGKLDTIISLRDWPTTPTASITLSDGQTCTPQGVVFQVNKDGMSGLIVHKFVNNLTSNNLAWISTSPEYSTNIPSLIDITTIRSVNTSYSTRLLTYVYDLNFENNTNLILQYYVSKATAANCAAFYCRNLGAGWGLPAAGQWNTLYSYIPEVNASLYLITGAHQIPTYAVNSGYITDVYWTSTEYDASYAVTFILNTGAHGGGGSPAYPYKYNSYKARAIRAF